MTARDSTLVSVWRELNGFAALAGAIGAMTAAVGFGLLFAVTRDLALGVSALLAAGVAILAAWVVRSGSRDIEFLIVAASFAAAVVGALNSPLVRGGMSAGIVMLAMVGTLLLPERKQRRFLYVSATLLTAQLGWPLFGLAEPANAAASFILSITVFAVGVGLTSKAKTALEQSERTRLEIYRRVPAGLFRLDPNGNVVDANPALVAMLGFSEQGALTGIPFSTLHESPDEWVELMGRLASEAAPQRFTHRVVRRDDQLIWVRGFVQSIRDESGQVAYYEGAIEDVTQRREAEEASRENAARFKNVFERAPIAIWEEDYSAVGDRLEELRAQGITHLDAYLGEHPDEVRRLVGLIEFLDVNPAGIALIGASSKGAALSGVVPETAPAAVVEGFVAEFLAIWDDVDEMTIEVQGATAQGGVTDLALSWAAGRRHDGSLDLARCVVAIQDVAIVKKAERELAALVESKDELIAAVSHELRTPITTILGMAFELRDREDDFNREELTEFVSLIADQSRELANIVEDLLVAARTEAGTLSIRPEDVDLGVEIDRIITTTARAPRLQLGSLPPSWADPLRVRQIIRNLLTNAERYGGADVAVETTVEDGCAVLRVSDDGPGIPADEQESIFEPYVRRSADDALPGSLGLGLPVSRRLARLMGGELVYRCDTRSTFELTLPLTPEAKAA